MVGATVDNFKEGEKMRDEYILVDEADFRKRIDMIKAGFCPGEAGLAPSSYCSLSFKEVKAVLEVYSPVMISFTKQQGHICKNSTYNCVEVILGRLWGLLKSCEASEKGVIEALDFFPEYLRKEFLIWAEANEKKYRQAGVEPYLRTELLKSHGMKI